MTGLRILKVELMRILRTRSAMLFLSAAVALSVFMACVPITYVQYTYEENGREITVKGREALAVRKNLRVHVTGEVTPEKIADGLAVYQKNLSLYGSLYSDDFPINVANIEMYPYYTLMMRLREVSAAPESGLAPDYSELSAEDALNFYASCRTHLTDLMNLEQKDNPDARRIAGEMYDKVQTPFYYYPGYNTDMAEYEGFYLFMLMFLCALITAPLFSSEYQTGADDILRSTKHGRSMLAAAKILSALFIGTALFAICMTIFMVISNTLFGWECRQTSMQILFSAACLLGIDVGQMQNLVMFAGFITILSSISFVLFVSSACKNTTISTGLTIAFCLLPSMFHVMIGGNIASYLRILLPSGGLGGTNSFLYALTTYFEFLRIGPLTIWTPWLLMIVPAAEIPIFTWLTVRTYCRRSM